MPRTSRQLADGTWPCPRCRYDLRAVMDDDTATVRCPECGRRSTVQEVMARPWRTWFRRPRLWHLVYFGPVFGFVVGLNLVHESSPTNVTPLFHGMTFCMMAFCVISPVYYSVALYFAYRRAGRTVGVVWDSIALGVAMTLITFVILVFAFPYNLP